MENKIVYATELADQARAKGGDYNNAARQHVQQVVLNNYGLYLGYVQAVNYDSKNDRYVVKFGAGVSQASTAKVTNEVAEYLLRERWHPSRMAVPSVYANMTAGQIDSVLLLYLSRE